MRMGTRTICLRTLWSDDNDKDEDVDSDPDEGKDINKAGEGEIILKGQWQVLNE